MAEAHLWQRARIFQAIRQFFQERGFLEVETPLLISANAPEEHIDPIRCNSPLPFLQTSPEICMKRLLCRGHERIFQICRCWRAGERGSRHLSEFTMLEWYRANSDYRELMADCEDLLGHVAACVLADGLSFRHKGSQIDPSPPWPRLTLQEAFKRLGNTDIRECIQNGLYEEILTERVEPALAGFRTPVFLVDFPAELAALARLKQGTHDIAERFELYAGGLELANGFSELNDPAEQRERFAAANAYRRSTGRETLPLPEPFLDELSRMPPSAGIALGLDRLVMLACDAGSIDEVVAFTPESL